MAGTSMQDIKRRIKSVTSIEHITNAMKLVSAAKLRRAKATFEKTREISEEITNSIADVLSHISEVPDQYKAEHSEGKRPCILLVTSNRGLAGSFNSNVIKEAERLIAERGGRPNGGRQDAAPTGDVGAASSRPVLACIGSKGRDFFAKRGYDILASWTGAPEAVTFADTREVAKAVLEKYDAGEIDEVVLVSTEFISTLSQHVTARTLLPLDSAAVGASPASADGGSRDDGKPTPDVEYEPSPEEVLAYLVPKYAEIALYGAVVESATCEHAARRMAMENATDNARGMISDLDLFYNRARQAAITTEITEIVSGSEAVS